MSAQTQPALAPPAAEPTLGAISPAQLAANRANAAHSTGPRTETGKARSSQNAVKSALTGRGVLLPTDDRAGYEALVTEFKNHYRPQGILETELVQIIADCHWRLRRIQLLENGYYVHGESQFAAMFKDLDPTEAHGMTMLQTHMVYAKELRNLDIQEARIDRKRQSAVKELKALQDARAQQAETEETANDLPADLPFESEIELPSALVPEQEMDAVSENGFEFSNEPADMLSTP